MTRRHSDFSLAARIDNHELDRASEVQALRATLWEQISRRLSAGARSLEVDICRDSATVTLAGVVKSFYAKQVLYQICRRCIPGFRVIDSTVVEKLPRRQG